MNNFCKALLLTAMGGLSFMVQADTGPALDALERGNRAEALAMLEASAEDPQAQLELARIYQRTDLDAADKWISRALASLPDSAEAQYLLGIIRGKQAQNATFSALRLARQSKAAFEKAVELEPDSPTYLQGLVRFHLSAPSIAGGDLDEAQQLAERLETLEPVQGVLAQANVARAREDNERAIELLEQGLAEHTESPVLAYNAGLIYQDTQEFEKAFLRFEQAIREADDGHRVTRYAALYQLGRTAVFSRLNTERGIAALTAYLDAAPEHEDLVEKPWAEYRLALLYEQNGRGDDARSIYQGLKIAEDSRLRKEVRKKI